MARNDGGPAFPVVPGFGEAATGPAVDSVGLSIRDYFAAQALASVGSNKVNGLGWKLIGDLAYTHGEWRTSPNMQAQAAYAIADAMLAERQKGGT